LDALLFVSIGFQIQYPRMNTKITKPRRMTALAMVLILTIPTFVTLFSPTVQAQTQVATGFAGPRIFADLKASIHQALTKESVRRGTIGLKVVSLDSGAVWFDHNSEKYFMPASNNKSFAVATALEKLPSDFRIVTDILSDKPLTKKGKIKGNLTVLGRGDITISSLYNDGDPYRVMDRLVEKIKSAGVKKIEGDIVGDDSYFKGDAIPGSWEWDDLSSYYGAEVSALPFNDNAVEVTVGAATTGKPCSVSLSPSIPEIYLVNRCTTSVKGGKKALEFQRNVESGVITVTGEIPEADTPLTRQVAITRPALAFVSVLKHRLEAAGIKVKGRARVEPVSNSGRTLPSVKVAAFESESLATIALRTMKPSQNMYTETILRTLGEQLGIKDGRKSSAELGLEVIKAFMAELGAAPDGWVQWDGSGLSRHNLVTPSILIQLYTYMALKSRSSKEWISSLPIGGVDGTIQNRFKGTPAMGNVRAKTGTIDQVSALSGYVTTASGERLVFSMIVNGIPDPRIRISTIDDVVVALASFEGRKEN